MWTAAAETGSCVHLTNAQPNKGEKSEREGRRGGGGGEEKEESEV